METKHIDFNEKKFEANGSTYYFSQTMSIDRFVEFERLQAHVGFGKDFKHIYEKLREAYDNMNKNKLADGAVIIHNLINGIAENLDKRDHPILQMCALFINREDEDKTVFDPDVNAQKIDDWKKEGYAGNYLFQLAFTFVDGFITIYNEITQDISSQVEEIAKKSTGKKG